MVSRRTSTRPGTTAAVPRAGPVDGSTDSRRAVAGARAGDDAVAVSSAMSRAVSSDWRWGRTTRLRGWIVAPWRSTRMVRSLALTLAVVTIAVRAATWDGNAPGSPKNSRCRANRWSAAASDSNRGSPASSASTTVSAQAHAPAAVRTERSSAWASAPSRGRTWPGPRTTSHVPSSSSPIGRRRGTNGVTRSDRSSRSWATCHPVPPPTDANPVGVSLCVPRNQNVTPEGPTCTARTSGTKGPSASARPSMQFAVSKASSAGTSSKRLRREAASTAPSDSPRPRSSSSRNGSGRWRRRVRRASAAQASEPIPSARSSGRWPGASWAVAPEFCALPEWCEPPRPSRLWEGRDSSGRRSRQPVLR